MGVLTVKENLMFSAELRLPTSISKKNKQLRVDDTIELLVRHTRSIQSLHVPRSR